MFSIHSDPLAPLGAQETGGQNLYVFSLLKQLTRRGWAVDVFTRWDSKRKKPIVFVLKNSRVIRLKGGPMSYIPKAELFNYLQELYQQFLNFVGGKNPYSLFHGHYWEGGWMAKKASQQFKKPFVQNFHSLGMVRFQTKKKYHVDGKENEYFQKRFELEKEIAKNAHAIISLAPSEKEALKNYYQVLEEKVHVIPGGVDLRVFKPKGLILSRKKTNLPLDAFVLLFVGRLEWRKGVGTLIAAARLLRERIKNLRVVVVGGKIYGKEKNWADFKEYQRLLKKAKEEKVEDIVTFVGRVDHSKLPFYYCSANVLVIPSYYEPFGLVALEGMACKVPVVASRVGGLSQVIEDGVSGLLFTPRNPIDLKEKILTIFGSKELADKLVENAYNKVKENFCWKKIILKIEEVYNSLLQK